MVTTWCTQAACKCGTLLVFNSGVDFIVVFLTTGSDLPLKCQSDIHLFYFAGVSSTCKEMSRLCHTREQLTMGGFPGWWFMVSKNCSIWDDMIRTRQRETGKSHVAWIWQPIAPALSRSEVCDVSIRDSIHHRSSMLNYVPPLLPLEKISFTLHEVVSLWIIFQSK